MSLQNNPIPGRVKDRIDGGLALYHPGTGLSLSLAGVDQEYRRSFYQQFGRSEGDNSGYNVRLGLRRDWFRLGETRIAGEFSKSDDVLFASDDALSYGIFASQYIKEWSLEPYLGYRYYDYDPGPGANGTSLKDIHVLSIGARMALDLSVQ